MEFDSAGHVSGNFVGGLSTCTSVLRVNVALKLLNLDEAIAANIAADTVVADR